MDIKGEMEKHIVTLIGNGEVTRLWLDNWHQNGVLIKHYGERIRYDAGRDRLCKVSTILHNGEWPRLIHLWRHGIYYLH